MLRTSHAALAAALICLPAHAAFAQEAAPAEAGQAYGQIVVTAQKREESAQDVPLTLTATSGERMEQLGVSELDELSLYVPGLYVQEQSANNPGFVIRGITSDSGSAQQSARVTLYYNGVDISRTRGAYQDLYDIERIEVVKGPQATLFGTASAIGAVSIISARPEPGFSGSLRAGYGNFDQYLLSGHVNFGNEVIAARFAGAFKQRDGYVRNIAGDPTVPNQNSAGIDQDDLNGQDQLGFRGSIRFTPDDRLTIDLIGTYDRQRNPGTAFVSGTLPATGGGTSPYGPAELSGSPFSEAVLGLPGLGLERDLYDANLTIEYELGDAFTLTSVTGYREFDSLEVFDADGSPAWYLEFAEDAHGWQISHESRIAYDSDSFRGFAGFNYFREEGRQSVPFSTEEGTFIQCATGLIPGLPCVAPDGTVTAAQATALLTGGLATVIPYAASFENRGENESFSIFADATFLPMPELELTAGVRILWEDRTSFYSSDLPDSVLSGSPLLPFVDTSGVEFSASDSFDAILPRFNLLYRFTPELNGYLTVSRGRRSPVVDVSAAAGPVPAVSLIPAENIWNYEGGLKFANRDVSAQAAVFYQTYENFQVTIPENGQLVTRNAGSASTIGVEAEISARLSEFVSVFANGAFIDASIDDTVENGIFAGNRFRLQSKWQLAGGFTVDVPLGEDIRFFATPSVTYQSKLYFELPNSELISQNGYALVNIRAGVSFADGRYEIAGFARNLFDEQYLIDAGNTGGSFGIPTFIAGEPRLYGVQIGVRF